MPFAAPNALRKPGSGTTRAVISPITNPTTPPTIVILATNATDFRSTFEIWYHRTQAVAMNPLRTRPTAPVRALTKSDAGQDITDIMAA